MVEFDLGAHSWWHLFESLLVRLHLLYGTFLGRLVLEILGRKRDLRGILEGDIRLHCVYSHPPIPILILLVRLRLVIDRRRHHQRIQNLLVLTPLHGKSPTILILIQERLCLGRLDIPDLRSGNLDLIFRLEFYG
jgi:hypothetical protein